LLLEGAIAKEDYETLVGKRHVDILQFHEAEVATLGESSRSVRVHVAAEGGILLPILGEPVGIEVSYVSR
jgi:hypothetical protein